MASGRRGSCAVCLFVEQQRPTSSRPAVSPVRTGQPSPNCVNCVRGKGPTSAPAPTTNRTLATLVPSGECDFLLLPLTLKMEKLRSRESTEPATDPPQHSVRPRALRPPVAYPRNHPEELSSVWKPLLSSQTLVCLCHPPKPSWRTEGPDPSLGLWDPQTQAWAPSWLKVQDFPACFYWPEPLSVSGTFVCFSHPPLCPEDTPPYFTLSKRNGYCSKPELN